MRKYISNNFIRANIILYWSCTQRTVGYIEPRFNHRLHKHYVVGGSTYPTVHGSMCPTFYNLFFTYSTARRRRRLSGRHMYMFSRHRKLHFCKIISFISGLECLQKGR